MPILPQHRPTARPSPAAVALCLVLAAAIGGCKPGAGAAPSSAPASDSGNPPVSRADTTSQLAERQITPAREAPIAVSSTAFAAGAAIPDRYSAYHEGASPPLTWTPVDGAKSYVLIVEDPDAPKPEPMVHWTAWNIPADAAPALPEGLAKDGGPAGMRQGENGAGSMGYTGMHPPAGDQGHHYHFQIFALDTPTLAVPLQADRAALVHALHGHVLAQGELVGVYQAR
jgi:Raf kinase inhibitor-like YbhB/YbcL family protein